MMLVGPRGLGTSANGGPESLFGVLPERFVEFRRRQIEQRVVGPPHARDDERVQKETNAGGSPPALDEVECDVPECVVQTHIRESAATSELREGGTPYPIHLKTAVLDDCRLRLLRTECAE
jgi:hypothetical protein